MPLTLYPRPDKLVKVVTGHLTINTHLYCLQEWGTDVIGVKHMTAKRPSPEGPLMTTHLRLFLVTLTRCLKSQTISDASSVTKAEEYRTQATLLQLPAFWSHLGPLQTALRHL